MPKLNKDTAAKVDETEGAAGGFEPLEPGIYVAQLRDVEVKEGKTSGQPYWNWTYEIPEDAEKYGGRRLWNTTSLSEKAFPFLKATFDAFGVPADTDTDDLIGRKVRLNVTKRTIQQGDRKGEMTNQVESVLPLQVGGGTVSGVDKPKQYDDVPF